MALCNHASSPIPAAPCEAGGISDQALRDALADALACLPLIDKGNRMVDKCAKFVATLQQCLNLLGTLHEEGGVGVAISLVFIFSNSRFHRRPDRA